MKKKWLLALLLTSTLHVFAQPRLPKDFHYQKLDNGLEVVVIENAKVPLVTIEMAVKNGAYTEGPEYSGLSHLFEHMFFKANKDYPDQEKFIARADEMGAIWNGTTNIERVNYYFTIDKDSLDAGLRFMNSAMRYPIYRTEDMEKERPVVDGEFQRAESDPNFIIWYESQKRLWGELLTRKNPIGDHHVINTATPEKMMIIKDKYYHPNNSILVIAGDVSAQQAFALAKQVYGDWQKSDFDPHVKYPIPPFTPLQKTEYFIHESTIAQTPLLMLSWQGPDYTNDSAATVIADVHAQILRLNSSKWQQALVDKGLASAVYFGYTTNRHVGPIELYVTPASGKLKDCYEAIMKELQQWDKSDYFTEAQLSTAKEMLKRQQIRSAEKPSSLPSQLTYQWASTSLPYFTDYLDNMLRVSKGDIQKYVRQYVVGKPFVAGLILSKQMNETLKPSQYFKN
jgi:zinc protease